MKANVKMCRDNRTGCLWIAAGLNGGSPGDNIEDYGGKISW